VLAALRGMAKQLDAVLSTVDPATLHARDAAAMLEAAAEVERKAGALKTLVADRAADAGTWASEGYRSPEAWLSQKTGVSYGEAAGTFEASAKLAEVPVLDEALRAGEVSPAQARAMAPAANDENAQRLVDSAKRESFKDLQRSCVKEKARTRSAEAERARHERIHKERYFRDWTDDDGAYRFEGKATAAVGARIRAAVDAEADTVFKAAYAEGRREPTGAYRMDALEHLITGGGANVESTVVFRVDAERLVGGDGVCETATGPVRVEEAIGAILEGAAVRIVVRDGVDITTVCSGGRHISLELKTAVFERDDYRCVRPGCGATQHLEMHHWRVDHAKGGPAAYWNLATVCSHDHDLITHGGHKLEGGPGKWSWIPPP